MCGGGGGRLFTCPYSMKIQACMPITRPKLGAIGPIKAGPVPSQRVPRSVELVAGPNWEQLVQLRPALLPVNLHQGL